MTRLFPLPNVVLFPNVFLPLHIFEPRYRAMVKDALAADGIIGMVLLRGASDARPMEIPAIYPVGCSGLITHSECLPDGRYNIILRGLEKFRVIAEDAVDDACPYRLARTEPIEESVESADQLEPWRQRLERLLDGRLAALAAESGIPPGIADGDVVNALSQYLALEPIEKQALLEQNGLVARCQTLVELLEIRSMMERTPLTAIH